MVTPGALLTTIGATAMAFAIAIGAATNIPSSSAPVETSAQSVFRTSGSPTRMSADASGANLASLLGSGNDRRTLALQNDCPRDL